MNRKWGELLPNSAETENLEFLREEALRLRQKMLKPWEEFGFEDEPSPGFSEFQKVGAIEDFQARIDERESALGAARSIRITRIDVPPISRLKALDDRPSGLPEEWISRVLVNIERELSDISNRRMLVAVLVSTGASVLAAIVALVTIVFEIWKSSGS